MTTRNKGELDRNPAIPGGLGASEQGAKEALRAGIQARASEEEVERQRQKLADVSGDGGGSVGASEDGRALRQPEEAEARRAQSASDSEGEHRRMSAAEDSGERRRAGDSGEEDRRRLEGPLRNERERLTRR